MSLLLRRQNFNPSCPSGGTFYACDSGTNFVGCCDSEACENGCSDGNLKPASFDPSYYGKFQDQQCPTGSRWYTCAKTDPPFMGCCKTNPCTNGCSDGDVTAGFLSSNDKVAADFLPSKSASTPSKTSSTSSSSSETSSSTSSPTSSKTSATPSAASVASQSMSTATQTVTAQPSAVSPPSRPMSSGTIAGASIGGVVGTALLLVLLAYFIKRKASRSRQHMSFSRAQNWGSGKEAVEGDKSGGDASVPQDFKEGLPATPELMSSPAPTYTSHESQLASELDAARSLQRPMPISPQLSTESHSPQISQMSPDSPRSPYQVWGNYSDGSAYRQ